MKYPPYKSARALEVNDGEGLSDWLNAQNPKGDFLDVNVWIALVDIAHIHHSAALTYWQEVQSQEVGIWMNRATMLGMMRVLAQLKLGGQRILSINDAYELCNNYRSMPFVHWLPETTKGAKQIDASFIQMMKGIPVSMCTDAYLAAVAQSTGLRMVTFDTDFLRFQLPNCLLLGA